MGTQGSCTLSQLVAHGALAAGSGSKGNKQVSEYSVVVVAHTHTHTHTQRERERGFLVHTELLQPKIDLHFKCVYECLY